MATFVNSQANSNDASGTVLTGSAGLAVTAGDVICVWSKHEGLSTTDTITDNAAGGTNTYNNLTIVNHANGDLHGSWRYAFAKASETVTITQTLGAARTFRRSFIVIGRPAASTTFAFDVEATAQGSSTTPSSGNITTAAANGFAVSGAGEYSPGAWTVGSGWTAANMVTDQSATEYRLVTGSSTFAGTFTHATMDWVCCVAAFKEVASGSTPQQELMLLGVGN